MAPHDVSPFKAFCYTHGFTLSHIARSTGITRARLYYHSRGFQQLTPKELAKVARLLGVDPAEIPVARKEWTTSSAVPPDAA